MVIIYQLLRFYQSVLNSLRSFARIQAGFSLCCSKNGSLNIARTGSAPGLGFLLFASLAPGTRQRRQGWAGLLAGAQRGALKSHSGE